MQPKKIKRVIVRNMTRATIYAHADVKTEEKETFLRVTLHRSLTVSRLAQAVPSGKDISYPTDEDIRRCFGPTGRFEYNLVNRTGQAISLTAGTHDDAVLLLIEEPAN